MALSEEERKVKRKAAAKKYEERPEVKEMRRAYQREYVKKNRDKINKANRESYQRNKEKVILRTNRNYRKNISKYSQYKKKSYGKIKLEVFAKIDPDIKCANCGCNDTRFLEVNHIKGGGSKEHKVRGDGMKNMILIIRSGKRGTENLNLLCRACNSLDHLERMYGKTGLSVVWDKKED